MKCITKRELYNEDWKTRLAKGYGNIPANTEVELLGNIKNMYGFYLKVRYNNIVYYIKEDDITFVESQQSEKI